MTLSERVSVSESHIRWLDQKLNNLEILAGDRHRYAGGCLNVTSEYHKAIPILVFKQLYGVAFAIVRLMFESYVRGVWLHQCATERQLSDFAKEKVPKFYELIQDLESQEEFSDRTLSTVKQKSWAAMNDYTHTGFAQVVRHQTATTIESNYEFEEICEVMDFGDSIGFLAAIACCSLADNNELAMTILSRIKDQHP